MAPHFAGGRWLDKAVKKMRQFDLSREDLDALTAGYYEDLLNAGAEQASTGNMMTRNLAAG